MGFVLYWLDNFSGLWRVGRRLSGGHIYGAPAPVELMALRAVACAIGDFGDDAPLWRKERCHSLHADRRCTVILSDIRQYMKSRGRASLDDLVAKFDGDQTAIEGMMDTLKAHGKVFEASCGSCGSSQGCSFSGPRIYVWATRAETTGSNKGPHECNQFT